MRYILFLDVFCNRESLPTKLSFGFFMRFAQLLEFLTSAILEPQERPSETAPCHSSQDAANLRPGSHLGSGDKGLQCRCSNGCSPSAPLCRAVSLCSRGKLSSYTRGVRQPDNIRQLPWKQLLL